MAPVVQKLDSAIQWIMQLVSLTFIHWIVIYPVDSAIQLLKNWDMDEIVKPLSHFQGSKSSNWSALLAAGFSKWRQY